MTQEEKQNQEQEEHQELNEVVEDQQEEKVDLAQRVEDLTSQVDELKDKLLRQMAESENVRTRSAKMIDEAREYAIFSFAKDIVPVMDNLSRALDHIPEDLSQEVKNIIDGVKMTKNEFDSVFKKHALESISPNPGDKFDYHSHHAISQLETEEYEAGSIVNTMQTGYRIKDRLIRPAAVVVVKK